MTKKNKFSLTTTQIILLSFLVTILIGSHLLALPISSASGEAVPYVDALFMATTSTCVTGLVTLTTVTTWSVFGQIVILLLIQIGGIGVIAIMSAFMLLPNKRMSIGERMLVQDAFNLNTLSGLAQFIKRILIGTLIVEACGALLYMTVFVPDFGARGIWISVFNAVSAFCNAGIDIIGPSSLCPYVTNPLVNVVTELLIIIGGIGYIVWWDVLRVIRSRNSRNRRIFRHFTLHTKITLVTTFILIFGGGLLIFIFEYDNPETIGNLSLFNKIQASIFQSITTRTAGFATLAQENLTGASSILCIILMFIGGSPVGTAGGVKTVTVAVLVATAVATVRNRDSATMFNRTLSSGAVHKAIAVCATFVMITLTSAILLSTVTDAPVIDVIYESVSATATVGLSKNLTPFLDTLGKIIIIFTMYFGRVGPISLAVALGSTKKNQNIVSDPVEYISIG